MGADCISLHSLSVKDSQRAGFIWASTFKQLKLSQEFWGFEGQTIRLAQSMTKCQYCMLRCIQYFYLFKPSFVLQILFVTDCPQKMNWRQAAGKALSVPQDACSVLSPLYISQDVARQGKLSVDSPLMGVHETCTCSPACTRSDQEHHVVLLRGLLHVQQYSMEM